MSHSMLLRELALAFDRLEATSGRRALVDQVAAVLRRARALELEPVVYLLQGTLRPPWEGVETGLAEKLLVATLAVAYGTTPAMVTRRLHRKGDLGLVAEALTPSSRRSTVTVRQAYRELLAVAGVAGTGSINRKIGMLAALLRRMGPLEARFLVRAAQGRLRLGVGDQTILEGVALAALGSRDRKAILEHAYNVRSDLGEVVRLAFTKGERTLRRIGPKIGVPVRPALAQRVSSAAEIIRRLGTVQVEPKYDGFRLQLHRRGGRVWIFSRRLENVTAMFPELILAARRQLRTSAAILEGEALVHQPETGEFLSFQHTMTRKRKTGIAESVERYPLRLFAFDLLYLGNRSWLERPQRERSGRLRSMLRATTDATIVSTDTREMRDAGKLQRYFDDMVSKGLEGIMAKRPEAPYQAGARGYDWVKFKRAYHSKLRDTLDLVLVGYLRGRGRRASLGIGSLLAAVYQPGQNRFRTVAKIGSGLSEQDWKQLRTRLDRSALDTRPARVDSLIQPDVWVAPRIVVEVLADEITRSPTHTSGRSGGEPGYALRGPRLLGIRNDKAATDATTEREVLALYRRQRKR